MKRNRGGDIAKMLSDPDVQTQLTSLLGADAFAHVAKLGSISVQGYGGVRDEGPPITEALVALALEASFTGSDVESFSQEAADWALENASIGMTASGRRLWLSPEARARVIDSPDAQEDLTSLLERHRPGDETLVHGGDGVREALTSAFLRGLLRGGVPTDLTAMPTPARKAMTEARRALQDVERLPPDTPSLGDCERQVALADLLDPLGIMIGLGDTRRGHGPDRFVGRESALRALRSMVDVLESQSFTETLVRTSKRSTRTVAGWFGASRPRMMIVEASGGLGKSTLIAKFVLDHALDPRTRFPFAILDFDRASLQPRNPASMLAEIARQVALQFPSQRTALDKFRHRLEARQAAAEIVDLASASVELRAIVTRILERYETRSFLVTFDTLEIAESDPAAMDGVIALLTALAGAEFPQLCVVASGRSGREDIESRLGELFDLDAYALSAFTVEEARQMVDRLAERLLPDAWVPEWSDWLAGRPSDPEVRREPLTLRLAVEIIRDAPPGKRAALVRKIAEKGTTATASFVGALYEMRVLDHIKGEKAKKLAWPGLVARTVSTALAADVLAPLCGLTREEALQGYESLAEQGWIVEREGDRLRHRRDLRARTLPLMREHDPERFDAAVRALEAHFSTGASSDPVEAAYYALLRGDSVLDRDWPPEILRAIADTKDDFPRGSNSRLLIEAATGQQALPVDGLNSLPASLLWAHVANVGRSLLGLDDARIEPRVAFLGAAPPPERGGPDAMPQYAVWQYLQVKTGRWETLDPFELVPPRSDEDAILFGFFSSRLSLAGDVPPETWARRYPDLIKQITAGRARKNWRALAQALVTAGLYDPDLADRIDAELSENPPQESFWGRSAEIALRTMLMFGRRCRAAAFGPWCNYEAVRVRRGVSEAELAILAPHLLERGLVQGEPLRRELWQLGSAAGDPGKASLVRGEAVLSGLSETMKAWGAATCDKRDFEVACRVCTLREPEWVVPFAYLVHARLTRADLESLELDRHLSLPGGAFGWLSRTLAYDAARSDALRLLDLADRMCAFDTISRELVLHANAVDHPICRIRAAARKAPPV